MLARYRTEPQGDVWVKDTNLRVGIVINAMRKNGITQEDAVARGFSQLCGYPQFNEQLEKDKPTKKSVKM